MIVEDIDYNETTEQKTNPEALRVANIPGMDEVTVRWIVRGSGSFTIRVDSPKGGVLTARYSM